jgi:23S rRNA pseudouridine1911/1915/1917 synthase
VEQESERIFSFSATDKHRGVRLDVFLASQISDLTRSRVQELIRKEFVKVNGRPPKSGYPLKKGDEVSLIIPPPIPHKLEAEQVDFSPVHEDASLIVLNKPPGLVIHPAPGHQSGTLVHGLLQHCADLSGIGGVLRPGIVHRLDKDTSGLVVVAKSDRSHAFLAKQFIWPLSMGLWMERKEKSTFPSLVIPSEGRKCQSCPLKEEEHSLSG